MRKDVRRFRRLAGVAAVFATCAVAGPVVQAADAGRGEVVPAADRLGGLTGGQLLGEEVRQLLELPVAENPLAGAGESCFAAGRRDKVLIAWTREPAPVCTVKPGTPVFVMTYFWECSDTELPPSAGGPTESGQRRCALEQLRTTGVFDAILVSIDGRRPVDVHSDRYLAVSRQTRADLPSPNILGVPEAETTFVAAAWVAMIRPLPPGSHTIRVEQVAPGGASTVTEVIVDVTRRHGRSAAR